MYDYYICIVIRLIGLKVGYILKLYEFNLVLIVIMKNNKDLSHI